MTIPTYEIDKGKEKRVEGIEVNGVFIDKVSIEDLQGKAIVFFIIYGQPLKDGSRYDLVKIQQSNGEGKDKYSDEYNLRLKPFLPKTISIHTVTLYCVSLIR